MQGIDRKEQHSTGAMCVVRDSVGCLRVSLARAWYATGMVACVRLPKAWKALVTVPCETAHKPYLVLALVL